MLDKYKNILCLGAHPDDIEIGCMGALFRVNSSSAIDFIVATGSDIRHKELVLAAESLRSLDMPVKNVVCLKHEDGALPDQRASLKQSIRSSIHKEYDLVITHYRHDMHQDHRLLGEISLEIFRHADMIAYEIPKYDGCTFSPTLYVPMTDMIIRKKVSHLMSSYGSQASKSWFTERVFLSQAAMRGVECHAEWAEAFMPVKLIV
ncbi:MAG: PIG-L family deacetylase [Chlorobiaceae bacterium]|nr:PIG-L family deacetylase [Chlorobiaceae bacterium]